MIRSILLVAAIVSLAEGAALVRFINTVPTRTNQPSLSNTAPVGSFASVGGAPPVTRSLTNALGVMQGASDRVGLQYFAQSADGTSTAAPTIVWTTIFSAAEATTYAATSPYAWFYAMPALRGYHTVATGTPLTETAAVDKPFGARVMTADNLLQDPAQYDTYEQSRLRADGVGLYLSFAAGTYRMQAYAAISADDATITTRATAAARPFQSSSVQFTFADNMVYTIIAYGAGQFGASVPLTGNTVALTLLTDSTDPVTFGMASVRFFNGFAAAGVSVDVYSGTSVSDAARIASSIAVGTVSPYIDVAPGVQKEFPVAQTGSTANYLASSTSVQRDVRAGSRTTIICAINNEATSAGFCRGIPSRVVAYVRLVNDLTGQDSLVQGQFGAQKLSQTRLNLWASYETPRPELAVEGSQLMGTNKVTGHPLTQEGLYPVLVNVAPGTITGYSEVYVPLYIMDMAVRSAIFAPNTVPAAGTNDLQYASGMVFTPIYKRVHFIIKTDGGATLSGRTLTTDVTYAYEYPLVSATQVTKSGTAPTTDIGVYSPANFFTLDEYVDAGEYYTVALSAAAAPANLLNGGTATTPTVYAYPRSDILTVYYRRDRTADTVSAGLTTGKASLNLIAFPFQSWVTTATTFSLQLGSTTTTPSLATVGATSFVAAGLTPYSAFGLTTAYPASINNEIQLSAGTYTYSSGSGSGCATTIPTATTTITVADQGIYDIFVLNVMGCNINGPSVSKLNFVVQQRAAATSADNAPVTSRRHPVAAQL